MYQNDSNKKKCFRGTSLHVKVLIAVFFILFASTGFAQKKEGIIRYLITTNYVKMMESVDYLNKKDIERESYVWGNSSESKAYGRLYFNASQTRYEDSEESANKDDRGYSWRRSTYTLSRDFEKKTIKDAIDHLNKTYLIEDTLKAPKWKILTEMKEIAGHICMKASMNDTLRKQKLVAWYALDIKNNGGPDRFYGLSGLILEININDGAMIYSADKIEEKKLTTELDFPKKIRGKKINEQEYEGLLRKVFVEKRKEEEAPFWYIRY